MLADAVILIISAFAGLVLSVFGLIGLALPVAVTESVVYFLSYFNYVRGFVPVDHVMIVLGVLFSFFSVYFIVKSIVWVYNLLPIQHKNVKLPF